jgi:23S rRNA pseudouridine2605 synthase
LQQFEVHRGDYGASTVRLAKFLAGAGVASRRSCEALIRAGRVTVDGETVTDPARDVTARQAVAVDGQALDPAPVRVVYALNKPAGVVSTARDTHGRPTVVELVPSSARLYPVGRLDADTTGLILLTNDGALAHRLTHPSFAVPKTYRAVLAGPPVGQATLSALRSGVTLDDGPTAPARVRRIGPHTIELTIHEGRKRQVKRMCEYVGQRVRKLERIRFGSLELGDLKPGAYRRLTGIEVERLSAEGSTRRGGSSSRSARARSQPS